MPLGRTQPAAVVQVNAGERAFDRTTTCRRIDDAGCLKRFPWIGDASSITTAIEHRSKRLDKDLNANGSRKAVQLTKRKDQRDATRDGQVMMHPEDWWEHDRSS